MLFAGYWQMGNDVDRNRSHPLFYIITPALLQSSVLSDSSSCTERGRRLCIIWADMDPCKLRLNFIIVTCINLWRSGGRARQSAKDLRLLRPLAVRPSSRGVSTDVISAENLHAFGAKHITKGLGRITEGIMTKGEGSYVVYDDGRRMLDFTCGIGVTSLGRLTMVLSLRHPSTTTLPTSMWMPLFLDPGRIHHIRRLMWLLQTPAKSYNLRIFRTRSSQS